MPEQTEATIANEIMEAQADLQTALGWVRMDRRMGTDIREDIEDRLVRSLARQHRLLDALGKPMYSPARHPDIDPALASQREGGE